MIIRNAHMLTLTEHKQIAETVSSLDNQFTDDIIDKAEFFDIEEDTVTLQTIVTLYDINGAVLSTATVEDYDYAMAYLEEVFDLEYIDAEDADPQAAAGNSRFGHAG